MPVAETLGIVGSIIAIVQISKTIIAACQFYIDAIDDCPSDLRVILIEVSTLKGIAKSLQYLTQPNVANSALLDQLASVTGPIKGCEKALKDLEMLLPSTLNSKNGHRSKRPKLDAAVATLAWPLRAGKAKRLLQEIVQHKTTINLALTAEFVQDLKDLKKKTEEIQVSLSEGERHKIYKWLETTNPSDIHNRSCNLYEPGTASWMLRTPEWPLWIEGKQRCIWISGIPGAGKSIMASYLIGQVETHCKASSTKDSLLGHAYYYCYFGHNQDESTHFLRWIVGQLCRQARTVPHDLLENYNSGRSPDLPTLLSTLSTILQSFARVYIVLDAVDESEPRKDLLRIIRDLSTDARFASLSLVATSRCYIDIEKVMETCSTLISMSNSHVQKDIAILVRSVVQTEPRYQSWPEDLRKAVEDTIPAKAEGMFRWAVCQLEVLKKLRPDPDVVQMALRNLPKTLDETYERIFLAIPSENWVSVQHGLHWILYHNELFNRRITLETLLHAIENSTAGLQKSDADGIFDLESLRECFSCLIMIEQEEVKRGNSWCYGQNTVSFAHYTVKEYLQSARLSHTRVGFFALGQPEIQRHVIQLTLRHALATPPDRPSGDLSLRLLDSDFQLYCIAFSVFQLCRWAEAISLNPSLLELAESFVNPSGPASEQIHNLLRTNDMVNLMMGLDLYDRFALWFWKVKWVKLLDSIDATFLSFLIMSGESYPHLAMGFAKTHSMLPVLTKELQIKKEVEGVYEYDINRDYEFQGCIPQIVAQWASIQPEAFVMILNMISDLGPSHFDLSAILLSYIGCHQHSYDCKAWCLLQRLLDFGSDANGSKGACVTPLQIATACWDLEGVGRLLSAGADVNMVGDSDSKWAPGSLMADRFNELVGAPPLQIIRQIDCNYVGDFKGDLNLDEDVRKAVEELLLQAGATESVLRVTT